jgi:RNA polymerase sigma-70 factor, ECF subfamily
MTISDHAPDAAATATDAPILAALTQGHRATAAELLVDAHAATVGRICMALLGSQSEAEAALRETLLAALDGGALRGEGTLRGRLLGIARRRCALRLETSSRQRADSAAKPSSAPERARRLLNEIRPSEREALVLHFVGEQSLREVGLACGLDEAAAQRRVSRGLTRLCQLMTEEKP